MVQVVRRVVAPLILIVCCVSHALAQEGDVRVLFAVPALPAEHAAKKVAAQSDRALLFRAESVSDVRANAVVGRYTVQEALGALFNGTPLQGNLTKNGVIVVTIRGNQEGDIKMTKKEIKKALLSGGAAIVLLGTTANAQEAVEVEDEEKEDVVVITGTRLQQVSPTSQVTVITREDIEMRNIQTAEGALSLLPQNNSAIRSTTPGADNTTGAGFNNLNQSVSADLRGLGAGSTLMLLNGNPITASALAQGGANFADIAGLPSAAIERIEVFNDSASAVYGTDAISGVVNIITRTSYDGLQASFNYDNNGLGGDNRQATVFGGVSGDRWNILGGFSYRSSDPTTYEDLGRTYRDYTALGGGDYRSYLSQPGRYQSLIGLLPGIGDTYATVLPGTRSALTASDIAPGRVPDDSADGQYVGKGEVYSAYFHAGADLTETVKFSLDVLASQRKVITDSGPHAVSISLTNPAVAPHLRAPFTGFLYAYYAYRFENETAAGLLPSVQRESNTDKLAISGNLSGTMPALSDWKWNVTAFYSSDKATLDLYTYQDALTDGVISGAINVFGDGLNADPAQFANLVADEPRINDSKTSLALFSGYTQGDLFEIPGGEVVLLAGVEYRQDRAAAVGTNVQGIGTNQDLIGTASRNTTSVFGELAVPLVGEGNALPGVQSFLVTGAVRYAHHSDVMDATVYRVGLAWDVIEGVKITGSHGTSFRAPSVFDLSEPLTGQTPVTPDYGCPMALGGGGPCFAPAQNNFGGNVHLTPEEGQSWSVGLQIAPEIAPGLVFGAGMQDIDFTGRIVDPLGEFGLEFTTANTELFPGVVVRDSAGALLELNAIPINLAQTKSRSYDVFADYRFSTGAGDVSLSYDGAFQARLDETVLPDTAPLELAGTSYRGPYWRHRASLGFTPAVLPNAGVTIDVTHMPGYTHYVGARGRDTSTGGTAVQDVDSFTMVDLFLSYRLDKTGDPLTGGWRAYVGVRNFFDADTPFMDTSLGYDVLNGNPFGRSFTASITKEF